MACRSLLQPQLALPHPHPMYPALQTAAGLSQCTLATCRSERAEAGGGGHWLFVLAGAQGMLPLAAPPRPATLKLSVSTPVPTCCLQGVNNNLSATHVPEIVPRQDAFAGRRLPLQPFCCWFDQLQMLGTVQHTVASPACCPRSSSLQYACCSCLCRNHLFHRRPARPPR